MKFGRIVAILVVLLALAGIGGGAWYWQAQNSSSVATSSFASTENDSVLAARALSLSDSLQILDLAIRAAQQTDSEPPVELIRRQNDLWSRYTWARSRLSDAIDAKTDSGAKTAPTPPADAAGLGSALGSLAVYLWIVAGLAVLAVVVLAWWILGRRSPRESPAPLTEPTMTRVDRNVRMPIPGGPGAGRNVPLPREATFSQMRAARLATEIDDEVAQRPSRAPEPEPVPAAPMPKTGRHAWENTVSQPSNNMPSPAEPTVVQDYVVSMAKRGRTSSEIARRLRIPQDQVDLILKLRRNG